VRIREHQVGSRAHGLRPARVGQLLAEALHLVALLLQRTLCCAQQLVVLAGGLGGEIERREERIDGREHGRLEAARGSGARLGPSGSRPVGVARPQRARVGLDEPRQR
jgi:hypothetical protein